MAKLIVGCGYLGLRVAERWRSENRTVFAVTRSDRRAAELRDRGLTPLRADVTEPASLAAIADLREIDTVLYAVGYDRASGCSIHEVYVNGLRNLVAALPERVRRFIYISTTGVYGMATGEWVDEETPCRPVREGGKACLEAERFLLDGPLADRTTILRLAGIYGPERIPRAGDLQRGEPIPAPRDGYLNLIHVDDAANIVGLVERREITSGLFCVSDGRPVLRGEYYAELARLLSAPEPRFIEPAADSPAALRAGSDKRISNGRLMRELQPTFLYPSYREGLAAIVRG